MKLTIWTVLTDNNDPEFYRDHLAGTNGEWNDVYDLVDKWKADGMTVTRTFNEFVPGFQFHAEGGKHQPEGKRYEKTLTAKSRAHKTVDELFADIMDTPGSQYDNEYTYGQV